MFHKQVSRPISSKDLIIFIKEWLSVSVAMCHQMNLKGMNQEYIEDTERMESNLIILNRKLKFLK